MPRPHLALAVCTIGALLTVADVAGSPSAHAAGECLADDWSSLQTCVVTATGTAAAPTRVMLTDTITRDGVELDLPDGGGVALDLNGKSLHLNASGTSRPAITVDNGSHLEVLNTSLEYAELRARGGANAAGIGGADGHGLGTFVMRGGRVIATGGANGAGIGGGRGGAGGTILVHGGDVTGYGGSDAAGFGGGNGAIGASVTATGGALHGHGSGGGAGFGGGRSGSGGTLVLEGGAMAAGYGGGSGPGAGAGAGALGFPGVMTVGAGSRLSLDGGTWLGRTSGGIGQVTVAGTLSLGELGHLAAEPSLQGGTGGMVSASSDTLVNTGAIWLNGTFVNNGTVSNSGSIQASPDIPVDAERGIIVNNGRIVGSGTVQAGGRGGQSSPRQLDVRVHNYRLAFDTSAAPGSTAPATQTVLAPTVSNADQSLPALPARSGFTALGWFTSATGGTQVSATSGLAALVTATPKDLTLHARYLAQQTVTWTSPAPQPGRVGETWTPVVTGGGSSAPVVVSLDASAADQACTVSPAGVVSFTQAGTCALVADQAGDATHEPAASVPQTVTVEKNSVAAQVSAAPGAAVHGQPITAQMQVSSPGTVQFFVDSQAWGPQMNVVGGAVSVALPTNLAVGAHTVRGEFSPTDTVTYAATSGETTVLIDQAETTTALTVSGTHLRAKLAVIAPGTGTPTGTVTFTVAGRPVGTVPVIDGEAVLAHVLSTTQQQRVGASYSGSADFSGSSASTARRNPVLRATVSGRQDPGVWNRGPVTVSFTCRATSARLVGGCPKPVTVRTQGAGQSLTRTISAADGGTASVVVGPLNIDSVAPRLTVAGTRSGTPSRAPALRCVARDTTSGVRSCRITRSSTRTSLGTTVRWTAKATDRAGNTRTRTGVYRLRAIWFEGAPLVGNRFVVKAPSRHTLVVTGSSTRPVYYDAELGDRTPHRRNIAFRAAGKNRWVLTITFDAAMRHHRHWNVGVQIGRTMHQVPIRIG